MKKHIKLLFRTLISNNACVEAARTNEKKYNIIAVIFAIFALFFAALPTCVTGFQQQGGNWLRGATYSFEEGMIELKEKTSGNINFTINSDHKLLVNNWNSIGHYTWTPSKDETLKVEHNDLYCMVSSKGGEEGKTDIDKHKILEVFVCTSGDFNLYVEAVLKNINPTGYVEGIDKSKYEQDINNALEKKKDDQGTIIKKDRTTSFIVFGEKEIYGALYQPENTNPQAAVSGDYGYIQTENLINDLVKDSIIENINKNCAEFFDKVYINPRRAATWKSTGIILGVDVGVVFLMGVMVFILTRGKNNPFRIYSFWDGQKIAYYASLTPGIISLFGFLMANMAMMLFILSVGVRVMWLSMRTLRYEAPAKA